jgi:hypothetical protein
VVINQQPSNSNSLLGSLWSKHDRLGRCRFCHIVAGVYTPVLAKHSKRRSLMDAPSIGVGRMQRV